MERNGKYWSSVLEKTWTNVLCIGICVFHEMVVWKYIYTSVLYELRKQFSFKDISTSEFVFLTGKTTATIARLSFFIGYKARRRHKEGKEIAKRMTQLPSWTNRVQRERFELYDTKYLSLILRVKVKRI